MMAERPISAKVLRRESPPPAVPRRDFMGRKTAATETDVAAPQAAVTAAAAAHVAKLHEPRRSNSICTTDSAQPPADAAQATLRPDEVSPGKARI